MASSLPEADLIMAKELGKYSQATELVRPITGNNGRLNVEPSNFQDILVMIFLNDSDR